jgi:uncharacterized membrane protein
MAAPAEPVLFQAVCTPPRSFSPRAFRVLAGLLGVFGGMVALLFLVLGAWPVLPILGLEVAFVLALVALHARRSARTMEVVMLTPGRLCVTRVDARGRREEVRLDPYWARAVHQENPAHAGVLLVESRGRRVEIGRHLAAEEKAALARALAEALAAARRPEFDNPQLRDG